MRMCKKLIYYEEAVWKITHGSVLSDVQMQRLWGRWKFTVAIYPAANLHFDWQCKGKFGANTLELGIHFASQMVISCNSRKDNVIEKL